MRSDQAPQSKIIPLTRQQDPELLELLEAGRLLNKAARLTAGDQEKAFYIASLALQSREHSSHG